MHTELLLPTESFNPNEFIEWRNREVEILSSAITELESENGLDINTSFDYIAENFILDPKNKLFLGKFCNSLDVSRAATLNILTTFNHKRNSGRPYASHPSMVANSIQKIATDISVSDLHESVLLSHLHDVIEEGPLRHSIKDTVPIHSVLHIHNDSNPLQIIAQSRKKIDYLFPENNTGRSVIELMEPIIEKPQLELYAQLGFDTNIAEYGTFARMIQRSQRASVGNVEIVDRIDDICDLDYIFTKNVEPEIKAKMLAGKLARCRHTVDSICDSLLVSKNLIGAFNSIFSYVFDQNAALIDIDHFSNKLELFYRFCDQNIHSIDESLDNYFVKVI